MKKISVRDLCRQSLIAAAYFAISLVFLPLSFGPVQVRIAEGLTLLPILSPLSIWGVTVGCALTNTYGIAAGTNILGAADMFFGTGATFVAAMLTRKLSNIRWFGLPILATLPPILINALVIGAELTFMMTGQIAHPLLVINMLQVAAGQTASCMILGLVMIKAFERAGLKI